MRRATRGLVYKQVSVLAIFLVLTLVVATGCGGGSSSADPGGGGGAPGINVVVITPSGPAAVDGGQTLPISVQVSNDSKNAGVTWSVSPVHKGDQPGTLTNVQAMSATYNPPANVEAPFQVTVTATSVSDPTRSVSLPVSLYPAPVITTQSSDLDTAFVNTTYNCVQKPILGSGVLQIPCMVNVQGGLAPYTWNLGSTFLPDGLTLAPGTPLLPATGTTEVVGIPIQAGPDPIVGVHNFALTVTDSLGITSTANLSISVSPGQLKVVTPTLLSTVSNVPYAPVALQASGGTPPYTWSLANGSGPLPPGMQLTSNGVITGTPTSGNGFPFAIQVKDSQSPVPAQAIFPTPQPVNAKIIILGANGLDPTCQSTGNTLQAGSPYAFLFSGFDADGPMTISGSFTSDQSGNLTGVEDIIRKSGAQTDVPLTTGSVIAFNQVGRGCLTLRTATSTVQLRVAPTMLAGGNGGGGVFIEGRLVEFDDANGSGTRGTGFFKLQDSTAFSTDAIAGPYAFRFSGWNSGGGHFAMAGMALASSSALSGIAADVNNAGAVSGALSGGSGTLSAVDANGRGTATIGVGTATYDLIFYVIDANHLVFNSVHAATSIDPLLTGEATTSAGPFSQATLNQSHIYRFGGSNPGTPNVGVGVLHFDGINALSGSAFERSGGTATTTTLSGNYAVDSSTGRFTFSGTGVPVVGYAIPAASGVTAYLVGTGPSASSGVMEFQTSSYPPGFQFSPINGRYGFSIDEMLDPQTTAFAGQSQLDTNGGLTADSYIDISGTTQPGIVPVLSYNLFHYTWSADGSGTYGGNTFMVTNGSKVYYIDVSPLNGHPAVIVGQRQQ